MARGRRLGYIPELVFFDGGVVMKRIALAAGAALLLGACGHDVRVAAPLGGMVAPGVAPWLQVAPGPEQVEVKGVEQKVVLTPAPALATALQSALGKALQADYFTDLTVGCDAPDAGMKVDQDDAPGKVALDLSLRCTVDARGYVSHGSYESRPTADVAADADAAAYANALPGLLDAAAKDIAGHLHADIAANKGNPRR
jgi:hypothetical protein